jgi:hypothetical protein
MRLPESVEPQAVAPQEFRGFGVQPGRKRCPHCGEAVTGTEASCPHCDTLFDAARKRTERDGPPWEKRHKLGWWSAWWETTKGVLFDPFRTFDRMRRDGYGPAFGYALFCNYIYIGAAVVWQFLLQLFALVSTGGGQQAVMGFALFVLVMLLLVAIIPLIATLFEFLTALLYHLGLMIFGGANQPYEVTYRVVAYAMGAPCLLALIPICGQVIAGIWGVVAAVIGLSRAHETDWWRALLAVLVIPIALAVLLVALFMLLMMGAAAAIR